MNVWDCWKWGHKIKIWTDNAVRPETLQSEVSSCVHTHIYFCGIMIQFLDILYNNPTNAGVTCGKWTPVFRSDRWLCHSAIWERTQLCCHCRQKTMTERHTVIMCMFKDSLRWCQRKPLKLVGCFGHTANVVCPQRNSANHHWKQQFRIQNKIGFPPSKPWTMCAKHIVGSTSWYKQPTWH